MRIPKTEVIDLEEYVIHIEYDGKGGLNVTVCDELGDDIEGIYLSDKPDEPESPLDLGFDHNLN
tara:strand:+ start:982 stop:1173 length:192 start_codon:yes stop_codon:yes gene_type:complete